MEPELKEIKAFVPTEIHPITGLTLSGGKCPCIFPEFKMIYVRVPGTGSSSFFLELGRRSKTEYVDVPTSGPVRDMEFIANFNHLTARQLRELIPKDIWNSYKKVGFIREPTDWCNSIYNKNGVYESVGIEVDGLTFSEFLQKLNKTPFYWFVDKDGEMLVDVIYRNEDLEHGVFDQYGIHEPYPRYNVSSKPRVTFTDEDMKIIHQKFGREYLYYQETFNEHQKTRTLAL